jgi:hypothetical protein
VERVPAQVNQAMRRLAYKMNRKALSHQTKGFGKRLSNTQVPAAERLDELHIPLLISAVLVIKDGPLT